MVQAVGLGCAPASAIDRTPLEARICRFNCFCLMPHPGLLLARVRILFALSFPICSAILLTNTPVPLCGTKELSPGRKPWGQVGNKTESRGRGSRDAPILRVVGWKGGGICRFLRLGNRH